MAKVQQISEITPSFAFTEFDFYKDYEESFKKCEIGRIHALLPLHEMAVRFGLVNQKNGNPDYLLRHPYGKRSTIGKENCKSGTLPGCPDTYLSNIIPHTRDNYVLMIQKSDRKTTKLRKKADEGSFGRYALVNQYQLL